MPSSPVSVLALNGIPSIVLVIVMFQPDKMGSNGSPSRTPLAFWSLYFRPQIWPVGGGGIGMGTVIAPKPVAS